MFSLARREQAKAAELTVAGHPLTASAIAKRLSRLNNLDKHRYLPVLAWYADLPYFTDMVPACRLELLRRVPLQDGDLVGNLTFAEDAVDPSAKLVLEDRVKAHVLICMLGCYLAWHLRRAWAPLTFTDENPPVPADPVLAASRSARAAAKASRQHDETGRPYRSFRGLLAHLGTLTRNQVRFAGTRATIPMLTQPTSTQRQAFDLIGAPIPLTLK